MKLNFKLSLVATSLVYFTVNAHEIGLSKQYDRCMDKSNTATPAMLDCISAETLKQDARLNKAYKNLLTGLMPGRKKELLQAQRTWISYRDANCGFYYDPDGGQIAHINSVICGLNATAERALELENFK